MGAADQREDGRAGGCGVRRLARRHVFLRCLAGAHGSRTHRATTGVAPLVLKTRGPTGTPPLPRLRTVVGRPAQGSASGRGVRARRAVGSGGKNRVRPRLSSGDERAPAPPASASPSSPPAAAAPRSWVRTCWPTRWRPRGAGGARSRAHRRSPPARRRRRLPGRADLAIIGTLDFFPPLVDDPRTTARSRRRTRCRTCSRWVAGSSSPFRSRPSPRSFRGTALGAIFAGASAKVREAGGVLAGGHTIRDPEPKYGLAVVGAGHPDRLLRKGAARSGDVLVLTKRLGTGLLVSGRRPGGRPKPTSRPPSTRCGPSTGAARRSWSLLATRRRRT